MIVVGIDPGKDGAVACWSNVRTLPGHIVLPTVVCTPTIAAGKGGKVEYDPDQMRNLLCASGADLVVLEKQQAFPKQGVTSTGATMYGFGLWHGIIVGLMMSHVIVRPQTWQAVCLRDVQGSDTKTRSILAAQRLFPGVDLRVSERGRKPHHGKADALLMAWWGARHYAAEAGKDGAA